MATVDGLTKARMLAIEAASVISGVINGAGHLILTKHDTSTIDAGLVVGPQGPQGVQGPVGPTSIVVCTAATRPTGGARFEGLMIYETDTDKMYTWDGAAWVYKNWLTICTSGTRPASPIEGLAIYETDTDSLLVYNGIRFDKPWNIPWGIIAALAVSNSASSTAAEPGVDLTGGSITAAFTANRRVLVAAQQEVVSSVAADVIALTLIKDGVQVSRAYGKSSAAGVGVTLNVSYLDSPTVGNHTYKLAIARISGTGTVQTTSGGIVSPHMRIEDLGPNGAPV